MFSSDEDESPCSQVVSKDEEFHNNMTFEKNILGEKELAHGYGFTSIQVKEASKTLIPMNIDFTVVGQPKIQAKPKQTGEAFTSDEGLGIDTPQNILNQVNERDQREHNDKRLNILKYTYEGWLGRESCFEKHLFTLQYLVKKLEYEPSDEAVDEIKKEILLAETTLKEESVYSSRFSNQLNYFPNFLENKDWQNFSRSLNKIAEIIRTLNVIEIMRLMSKVKDASATILRKDILLFLG